MLALTTATGQPIYPTNSTPYPGDATAGLSFTPNGDNVWLHPLPASNTTGSPTPFYHGQQPWLVGHGPCPQERRAHVPPSTVGLTQSAILATPNRLTTYSGTSKNHKQPASPSSSPTPATSPISLSASYTTKEQGGFVFTTAETFTTFRPS